MSKVSLIIPIKCDGADKQVKKRGNVKRDNRNEPVAANTELESGDNNEHSGTKFVLLASAVTVNHLPALCGVLVKFIQL